MVKATLVPSGIHYQGTPQRQRYNISKDSNLQSHCYKNLTLHMVEKT
jgi:hypothetical protein